MPTDFIGRLKEQKSANGVSAYDHLAQLIQKVSNMNSNNKLAQLKNFELLSDMLKNDHFLYKKPQSDSEVNNIQEKQGDFSAWVQNCMNLLRNQIQQFAPIVQNFSQDARVLQQAGISFGEDESYLIWQSLIKLSKSTNANSVRFWGKILCSGKDYYVAEGTVNNNFSDDAPQGAEAQGTGCNRVTFWVCHSVLDQWVELPLVTPEQIKASRQISYLFTGNLNSNVNTYPAFHGQEKHLLKAQIVRITYASYIVPKGIYKPNDDNPKEVDFEDEAKLPDFTELNSLENWSHYHPQILQAGRISHRAPTGLSEEDAQAYLDKLNEEDPEIERLKPLSEDQPFPNFETNWLLKTAGDQQIYNQVGKDEGTQQCYGCVVLKSLRWQGMTTVGWAKGYCSVYVGYGKKNGQPTFYPASPDDIPEDPEDQKELPEPNPKDAPVEPVEGENKPEGEGEEGEAE